MDYAGTKTQETPVDTDDTDFRRVPLYLTAASERSGPVLRKEVISMDNVILEKIYQDSSLTELKVTAEAAYAIVNRTCFVSDETLRTAKAKIAKYVDDPTEACRVEFGTGEGGSTPAFSLEIMPGVADGRVKMEADMEIADNDKHLHKTKFYIGCDVKHLKAFGESLTSLAVGQVGKRVYLTPPNEELSDEME